MYILSVFTEVGCRVNIVEHMSNIYVVPVVPAAAKTWSPKKFIQHVSQFVTFQI